MPAPRKPGAKVTLDGLANNDTSPPVRPPPMAGSLSHVDGGRQGNLYTRTPMAEAETFTPAKAVKEPYTGGYHKLPVTYQVGWKPNWDKREIVKPANDVNADKWTEDLVPFTDKEGEPAVISSVEELMMFAASYPPPHYLFEQERYCLYPEGCELAWEDPMFQSCGCVKAEVSASKLMEDPALGMEFWLTILALFSGGLSSAIDQTFDLRALRVTRKKTLMVEFWLGRKHSEGSPLSSDVLDQFKVFLQSQIESNLPGLKMDRYSCSLFQQHC
eukprot:GHVH01001301.1.p1 GENE.GHVH01001301.1~~GHVH01001301.1.p1  ORF type:complete len:273 (+),score=33.83 GHVH01001301.1:139-957(+)